ncbi:hypothetical protein [Bradyrhizobium sp. Cp5.3]|uniref:hypothetical protein n=1 Tax=Bradyrhizobium sp. Cp5.3 TaxID=443598 RepID=UPI00041A50CB|nr:hypothetical protein [Bradyrhizobium sp. Cp5.3]
MDMSKTRNNHYVPQWYQEGFFEPGKNTLAYLDLTPKQETLADGRVIKYRGLFDAPTRSSRVTSAAAATLRANQLLFP